MTRQPARMRTRLELAGLGKGECLRVELDRMDVIVVRPEEDEVFARGRSHCTVSYALVGQDYTCASGSE
jgi:hypothetical protein